MTSYRSHSDWAAVLQKSKSSPPSTLISTFWNIPPLTHFLHQSFFFRSTKFAPIHPLNWKLGHQQSFSPPLHKYRAFIFTRNLQPLKILSSKNINFPPPTQPTHSAFPVLLYKTVAIPRNTSAFRSILCTPLNYFVGPFWTVYKFIIKRDRPRRTCRRKNACCASHKPVNILLKRNQHSGGGPTIRFFKNNLLLLFF